MQLSFWFQKLHNCSKIECIERRGGISNLKSDIFMKKEYLKFGLRKEYLSSNSTTLN
jgi:hypothetical protein